MSEKSWCCGSMEAATTAYLDCSVHACDPWACPDTFIHRSQDDIYGLIYHEKPNGIKIINFCPFCGADLKKHKNKRVL